MAEPLGESAFFTRTVGLACLYHQFTILNPKRVRQRIAIKINLRSTQIDQGGPLATNRHVYPIDMKDFHKLSFLNEFFVNLPIIFQRVEMARNQSISKKFFFSMLVVTLISIGLLGCLWTWQQYSVFRAESAELSQSMLNSYQDMLINEVQRTVDYIEYRKSLTEEKLRSSVMERVFEAHELSSHLYKEWKGQKSDEEVKKIIIESLRPIRFNNGRGYFFILDLQGFNRLRSDRPEFENKNMIAAPESAEAHVVKDMIRLVEEQGEGFYQYDWSKPGKEGLFPKIAFVKLFKPYRWIIGTGEYLDDFQATIKSEVLNYIEKIKFGRDGYIFVTQWDGMDLTGPAKGRNMLHVTDVNGVKIVQEMIALAKSDGGFLSYVLPKFPGLKPDPKLSYVKGIKEWQWYVGAGVYIDDIEKAIETKRNELNGKIAKSLLQIFAVLIGALVFTLIFSRINARKIVLNFKLFNDFFEKGARESVFIEPNQMAYEEIEKLANSANKMIMARKQARAELQENKDWLQSILDSIQAGVIAIDPAEHTIFDLNRAAAEMIGSTKENLINTICYSHICPNVDRKCPVTDMGQTIEQSERVLLRVDGTRIPILKTVNCATINGKEYLIESFLDISEKKKLESMLQQAQKMEAIGSLAGGIAHDFNNILSPIIGLAELLLEDLPEGSLEKENAAEIFNAGKRGSELVKQILAFSRQSEHKMIPTSIQNILKEVLKLTRSTIPSNIEINQDIQMDCGAILADPIQIHQVAMNIITNAYHAVEDGGGVITVRLKEVEWEGMDFTEGNLEPGRYAMLSIFDTGHGMTDDLIKKIFNPYFTTKEQGRGTGLGLAVAYGIIKEHQGGIKVSSELGKGSIFEVYLPLLNQANEAESMERPEAYLPGNERILLVDDEEPIAKIERQMLERLGYTVTSSLGSIDALKFFKANPYDFDVVITDMTMPDMTGDQLARELIAIRSNIPIIICTGFSDRINPGNADAIGVKGLLTKPIVKSELAAMVRKVLDEIQGKTL